ncbi:MAG: 50S ribosomal protein L7/L12 [Bacillota bacterium]|nr:50S ribosomal protein L7/L12 [Bacillota bacterium]NLL26071.1 50S ribosomal protein L7/L12 [Erysipelotrichia bacterium]
MAKLTNEEIIASLKEMTILELNDLVKAIEKEFGVTAVVAQAPVQEQEPQEPKGPTEVTIMLKEVGQTKIAVIKAVKEATGIDLMSAKKIVDACTPDSPSVIKENVKIEDADAIKEAILAAGAVVEYK